MSPTLFACYINDLAEEIKSANIGQKVGLEDLSILLYADNIALIAPTLEKAQVQLDILSKWCAKWQLSINGKKSQTFHVRNV